jgi:hypothetical protein
VSPLRCSEASRAAGEPLAATASVGESWLLVEIPGTWPRDVAGEGGLAEPAGAAARDWLARTPRSRLLFLRRPGRRERVTAAYVVHAGAARRECRRLELASPAELAHADLDAGGEPWATPLVLVCGHGSRDACCALLGTPVYGALAALDAADVWISSHHGGHRFAANVLVLPAGLHLGRVEAAAATRVVGLALSGRIELDHYRGRTFHEPAAQAAEIAVREATGLAGVDDLRLVSARPGRVRFAGPDGAEHEAVVEEVAGPEVPPSCGAAAEPQSVLAASAASPNV